MNNVGGFGATALRSLLPSPRHQSLVAVHTEDALRGSRISQVLNLSLAVTALEASRTKGLVAGQYGKVLDLVAAVAAAVCAVVANQ